jgi:aminoglycoside phosphotransferase (APT) family kinase protein
MAMEEFATPKTEMRLPIDLDRVARFVSKFAPHLPSANLRANQFSTGTSNPTYLLWSEGNSDTKFVLRRQPNGELQAGAHQLDREYKIWKFLENTPVPSAKVYAYSDDASVCGAPFYIMEAIPGRVLEDGGLALNPDERAKLWKSACTAVSALHDLDHRDFPFAKTGSYAARLVRTWDKQFAAVDSLVQDRLQRQCLSSEMRKVSEWLQTNINLTGNFSCSMDVSEPVSIVHGDLGLHNFIVHPTEPKINAILDWEMATVGNPIIDMNYLAGNLTHGWRSRLGSMALPDPSKLEGTPTEYEFVERYCDKRGLPFVSASQWDFCTRVNLFRSAAIAQGVLARGLNGTASSGDSKNAIFQDSYVACVKGALSACGLNHSSL